MTKALRELSGAWNFRDVADGAPAVRPGRLFRSGELSRLDDDGRATLNQLGITDVADLRATREVARRGPGLVPDGVEIHLLPFPDLGADESDTDGQAPHEVAFQKLLTGDGESGESELSVNEAATRYMIDEYREFPTRNGAQRALHRVVTLLAAGRPVLTHCFAGKDRTGFVVATVLETIGVDHDTIVADFLRSNDAAPQLRARISEMIAQRQDTELTPEVVTFTEARLSDGVLGVREEYLAAARQTIEEQFGSLDAYLRAAGISGADVDQLRGALLAFPADPGLRTPLAQLEVGLLRRGQVGDLAPVRGDILRRLRLFEGDAVVLEQRDALHLATTDHENRSAVGIFLGAQVGDHRCDVLGRQLLEHFLGQDVLGHPGGRDRGDGVGVDVVLRTLQRQAVDQADQPELGGPVVGLAEVAEQATGRGSDHHPAVTLLTEVRPRRADHVVSAVQVHLEHGVPVLKRHLVESAVAQDSSVAHHAVNRAEL